MKMLYSNISPLKIKPGQETVADCIRRQISYSDSVDIAVGYISRAGLEELDRLVDDNHLSHITLIIGMYYSEGMPEASYHIAMALNEKWVKASIGEIRIVKPMKYHGKVYCFSKDKRPFAAILGSANLGVLKPDSSSLRQYEVSTLFDNPDEAAEIAALIEDFKKPSDSERIDRVKMQLIHETNIKMNGVEHVNRIPPASVDLYRTHRIPPSFELAVKVPAAADRFLDDNRHYTKSNLNVCYAAPRSTHKGRNWYETQLTVDYRITDMDGYPRDHDFILVTDDGYEFRAHTTSDHHKQFTAVGDDKIMGYWIKGRLAAAGLVTPIDDVRLDANRDGMITKEMLAAYGCDKVVIMKTDQQKPDENGDLLDVWLISFEHGE